MKIDIYTYRCEPFGHVFQAYRLPPISYGEFLLRDETGSSLAYLNALTDPTLFEVGSIVERLSKPALSMNDSAEITQRIYGVAACDADIEGRLFKIGQFPRCPICSSTSMRSWAFTNPPKWAEINVPSVTHIYWDLLSDEQKFARVELILASADLV